MPSVQSESSNFLSISATVTLLRDPPEPLNPPNRAPVRFSRPEFPKLWLQVRTYLDLTSADFFLK